ncbi:lysine-ketoglutarate reductase/saccharopine dehydrogenase bifunctional enzyme [Prunus dulcis]|uniref:Lysine-ketoglutarate reductase/saccharopine dehydrogenase bifunctional enzyme n=1 Tax=Prunus dulcis TaxID=3755 RepID=A0A4Y1RWM4_PRUDU|nr:lysine-ketoglutarate reductase/saccharopine dehydrogenase bifunctional enzyme [Prunus dulcis]
MTQSDQIKAEEDHKASEKEKCLEMGGGDFVRVSEQAAPQWERQNWVARIIVQPSTKRIHHDAMYEDIGCEISEDLSQCGLILGIKQPKILAERVSLYDYELIVGDQGKRLLAFGKYAGRAGFIDFLRGLGQRYLSLGYSTPFLSLGASYMYTSLAAAKAAVISVGEEIATLGLPSGICPLVFVFTGSGNVSSGAQEIFKLLPHTFVDPSRLPELSGTDKDAAQPTRSSKRVFHIYGCVVTSKDMVQHKDSTRAFDKADYYAHPEHYNPVFHERIAPYASVIVNCMYWEKRFPRLLSTKQFQDLMRKGRKLIGISDITCDIGGSIEFVNQTTSIDSPFFRYDPVNDSYHHDMDGAGLICQAVDILPTEFAKEASQHFGDILSQFVGNLASTRDITKIPAHLTRACITHGGVLTSLYEYITRMRKSGSDGHLFDQFLINEALDIIEAAGGSFHLVKCDVGQCSNSMSFSELEVGADDRAVLDQIIDSLTSLANPNENYDLKQEKNKISLRIGKVQESPMKENGTKRKVGVLIIGAGRVCQPAAEMLASISEMSSQKWCKACLEDDFEEKNDVQVTVASLYLKDAEEITEGIPNTRAVQLDVTDTGSLHKYISEAELVISLLPAFCHITVANACIELKRHLVTASYVDDSMSKLDEKAQSAGITILGEMGLDPGIDHMMAMKMINQAHVRKGKVRSFTSYCGGLPSPAAANNPLAYKFRSYSSRAQSCHVQVWGEIVQVDGMNLYDSAVKQRIPNLPAFALECLPNRNSLVYGELYGIGHEASTVFRGTLRYEGFGEIMGTLSRIGLFESDPHPLLKDGKRPTFRKFLSELLKIESEDLDGPLIGEKVIHERIIKLGYCKDQETALRAAKTITFLGLHDQKEIPASCRSAFDVSCLLMEDRLAYSSTEQDMVLLHHEVEVEFPDGLREKHSGTLLEFGQTKNGKMITAMAFTVGIPAAIGALLILGNKVKTRGVLRPIEPEVYVPAMDIIQAYGIKVMEKIE